MSQQHPMGLDHNGNAECQGIRSTFGFNCFMGRPNSCHEMGFGGNA